MKPAPRFVRQKHRGVAIILSMLFVLIFSALAVALSSMSGMNLQLADNHHRLNRAAANAESGLHIMRYWLGHISVPASTSPSATLDSVAASLYLATREDGNLTVAFDGATISIQPVMLDSTTNSTFDAQIRQTGDQILQVDVTGRLGQTVRTIRVDFDLAPARHSVFEFGLATRGPVEFQGNPTLVGLNSPREADILIESPNDALALLVAGNTNFDGDISVANAEANVDFRGDVLIAGRQGQDAIDDHVFIGADSTEFPVPDTAHFRQYTAGDTIDSSTDLEDNMVLTNATIEASLDPDFKGNIEIRGVLFIEAPNTVIFSGNVLINGMIVADGDVENPGTNSLTFLGNFASGPFPEDSEFDSMRHEAGSSLLAPGFAFSLAGNFQSLGGVMAVSGAYFSGNVDAVVEGTIINYADQTTVVEGNPTLRFDHSDSTDTPAGFDSVRVLQYDPSSYLETVL